MSNSNSQVDANEQLLRKSTLLASEGEEVKPGVWERGVYLAEDGFVYQAAAEQARGRLRISIVGKRAVGEYLRWVDGLFEPGGVPDATNAIHYRAARMLRELL